MPTFNRAHFLGETIESIINQSFQSWECIIIDDGSTDQTKEILQPLLNCDSRFKYLERDNKHLKGPSGCRNQGIDLARGRYIVFFDSDDIVHPEALEISTNILQSSSDVQFCYYGKIPFSGKWDRNTISFKTEDKEICKGIDLKDIEDVVTQKIGFACCTVVWEKNAIGKDRFNEKLTYAEEWEFYIRLLLKGIKGLSTNKVLYFNRKHLNSNTGEYWNNDQVRKSSKVQAVKLVTENLKSKNYLTRNIIKYFLRLGFLIKERDIINYTLGASKAGVWKKIKYKGGFLVYPFIKPIFILKSKLQNS